MSKRIVSRLFVCAAGAAALAIALITAAGRVEAQSSAPPYAMFQFASITGSGNTITAANVPVVTSPGVTVYENLTFQFNADTNGNLTLAPGYPQAILAPILISSGFKAGTYIGPSTVLSGKMSVVVSGPGVNDGGATQWSLTTASGADTCTYPTNATWYVGPLSSSPWSARLQTAKITSTSWSYGTMNGPNCYAGTTHAVATAWNAGTLIGVSQTGGTLTIASFTNGGTDTNVPVDQVVYTLQP